MSVPIHFLFDYISPYAYLASSQIGELGRQHGRTVVPVPVLFAALLGANGQLGPAEIPNKRRYFLKDSMRKAKLLGLPLRPPPSHPFNPLLALRVTVTQADTGHAPAVVGRLFHATWGSGAGVESAAQVGRVLEELELDAEGILARAATPAVKEKLRRNTEWAVEIGAFGVPTMLVDGELFWGTDSLVHLDHYLAGAESLDREELERWSTMGATAERRR